MDKTVKNFQVKDSVPFNIGLFVDDYNSIVGSVTSPKELIVRRISHSFANNFVLKHHYLHRKVYIARNVSYGLYAKEFCVGVCMFGYPVWIQYPGLCPPFQVNECPELIRLSTMSKIPKNSESYFVSRCLHLLVSDWAQETGVRPKCVTSFCDNALGFDGALYKATNFKLFRVTQGRPSNPGKAHGKWGANDYSQDAMKTMYVYYYDRKVNLRGGYE